MRKHYHIESYFARILKIINYKNSGIAYADNRINTNSASYNAGYINGSNSKKIEPLLVTNGSLTVGKTYVVGVYARATSVSYSNCKVLVEKTTVDLYALSTYCVFMAIVQAESNTIGCTGTINGIYQLD